MKRPQLEAIRKLYGMSPPWPLGEGEEISPPPVTDKERAHLDRWRWVRPEAREHLEALARMLQTEAGPAAQSLAPREYDFAELRRRGALVEVICGDVAALSDPSVAFEGQRNEREEMPAELHRDGVQVAIVHGESMSDEGLVSGDRLVVRPAREVSPGECVVAWTSERGMVVKRFSRIVDGTIYLGSCGQGLPVSGRAGEEVQIRGIVEAAYRKR